MKPTEARPRGSLFYVGVWVALVALTALSYMASLAHFGGLDLLLSLLVAVAKSSLVTLFFMHLAFQRGTQMLIPIVTGGFIVLLLSLIVLDVTTRHTFPKAPIPAVFQGGTTPGD